MFAIRRTTLMEIVAVATPVLVVGATRVVMSPAPTPVKGGQATTAAVIVPVDTSIAPPSPEQLRAAEWARTVDLKAPMRSPLDHPISRTVAAAPHPGPDAEPFPTEPQYPQYPTGQSPLSQFNLSATMGNASTAIAAISGHVYRVGDELRPGYEIIRIDTKTNEVDVRLPDGSLGRLKRRN